MTHEQFKAQMTRLEKTFKYDYPVERLDLIMQSVMWMELGSFAGIVSHFISTFRQAPLPKDFKEAAIQEKNRLPNLEKRDQAKILRSDYSSDALRQTLARDFPGCHSLAEAIKMARQKIRVKKEFG